MARLLLAVTGLCLAPPAAAGRRELARLDLRRANGATVATDGAHVGGQLEAFDGAPALGGKAMATQQGAQNNNNATDGQRASSGKFKKEWLTFWYWRPLFCSVCILILSVEVGGILIDRFYGFTLQAEVFLLTITMYSFATNVLFWMDPRAAGMKNLLAVATIGCTLTFLMDVFTVSMLLRKTKANNPMMMLATDIAGLFRPALHLIVVCIILDVVATEASIDWGQMAVLLGFFMLGISLSLSGVIGDILAHVFLRMDNHFREGDFIVYNGGLVQIAELKWRHTVGITQADNALIYIPNNELTAAPIVNQSQDNDRVMEVDILVNMDAEKLNQAVTNAWYLLAQTEDDDFSFLGLDGRVYTNQFNTPECAVWVKETCDAVHIKFTGAHYFSNPPPYEGEGDEPPWIDRQQEWEQGWQMQVEWFSLQLKKMNECLGDWPFVPEDVC